MKIGVFNPIFSNLSLDDMLDYLKETGIEAVEIGTGAYPGSFHCDIDLYMHDKEKREAYLKKFKDREIEISGFSCHGNPLDPNPKEKAIYDNILRKTIVFARLCNVSVVNCFSGTPGDGVSEKPNWPVIAWPDIYRDIYEHAWEKEVIPYWQEIAKLAEENQVKVAIEMHGGFMVHSPYTALKLRAHTNAFIGVNFDPSHLWWQGIDPVEAIKLLGKEHMIFHVHAKDTFLNQDMINLHGVLDLQPYGHLQSRAWYFRTVGYGHDLTVWYNIVEALEDVGYQHVLSIEHEDESMSVEKGFQTAFKHLKEVRDQMRKKDTKQ